MKIEFEITEDDVILLINSLNFAISKTTNASSRNKLKVIIQNIRADAKIDSEILKQLKYFLKKSQGVNPNKVLKPSKLKLDLNLSTNYIKSPGGLGMICNNILINLRNAFMEDKPFKKIPQYKVIKCKTVNDLIKMIQDGFEAL